MRKFLFILCVFVPILASARTWPPVGGNDPFSTVENPLSEGNAWINGKVTGVDWNNIQIVAGGKAIGGAVDSGFDDSIANLTGFWGPNQTVCGTVSAIAGYHGEVALRLRATTTAHNAPAYEINFSNTYSEVVLWTGALGSFSVLQHTNLSPGAVNGDRVCATINGTTITRTINGVAVGTPVSDATIATGAPGIEFFVIAPFGVTDQGLTNYSATDGLPSSNWLSRNQIINPSRAVDWASQSGFTIPSATWTQCGSTINPPATAASIISAMNACASNTYVKLGAGTFSFSGSGVVSTKSRVVLRGSGANQTFISYTASGSCGGIQAANCLISTDQTYFGSPGTVANVTAGLSQGSTQLTLSSATSFTVGKIVAVDQCNDGYTGAPCTGSAVTTSQIYVCDDTYASPTVGCISEVSNNASRPHRSQIQMSMITNVAGNVVTISPPLAMPNWRSGQNPQVWAFTPIIQSGFEDLSFEGLPGGTLESALGLFNCYQCWVKGVRFNQQGRFPIHTFQAVNSVMKDNYFYFPTNSDSYCIQLQVGAWNQIENNIFQQCTAGIVINGPDTGSVIDYNWLINMPRFGSQFMAWGVFSHTAGAAYVLYEGNQSPGLIQDSIHGTTNMVTFLRNQGIGQDPGCGSGVCNNGTNGIQIRAYNRYQNLIGNVNGQTNYHTSYKDLTTAANPLSTMVLGWGNQGVTPQIPVDAITNSTMLLWGSFPACTSGSGCGTNQFNSSEVPSSDSVFPTSVPFNQTIPPSYFYTSIPSWWPSGKAWPVIGPDIAGGNMTLVAGHANSLPARDCFTNVMAGPTDGSGSVLSFNASNCYGGGATAPAVQLSLTNVDCGSHSIGGSGNCIAVTLTNTGNASLTISSISVAGTNPGDFSQSNNCGTTVTAGSTCIITPGFTPIIGGARAAIISISDNAAGSPQSINLVGNGVNLPAPAPGLFTKISKTSIFTFNGGY